MDERSLDTRNKIQQIAMEEFAEKGFLGASLRQIVKKAGVTTGAFYGYFSSKEALFNAIVEPHAAALMGRYMEAQTTFAELPEEEQPSHMGLESSEYIHWMVDYICRHREPVKLLLCRSEGTGYEHFVHNMVEVEVEYTIRYMEVLRHLGQDIPELDEQMCHIIASGMFNGLFEIVIHDMPRDRALHYVDQLRDFYTAGWLKLMGQ
ncbi:MAG TPA: TetR/AcrR family transcriptional regulator [Candidatus Anaerobutyricum avicola]|nr:TetR/AcrR family transcriptional regulator [Candidatus Anaerobutyricum avicola]